MKQIQKNKARFDETEIAAKMKDMKEFQSVTPMKNADVTQDDATIMKIVMEGNDYIEQYDPNQDFAIFGLGSEAVGGPQTLQQKIQQTDELTETDLAVKTKSGSEPHSRSLSNSGKSSSAEEALDSEHIKDVSPYDE